MEGQSHPFRTNTTREANVPLRPHPRPPPPSRLRPPLRRPTSWTTQPAGGKHSKDGIVAFGHDSSQDGFRTLRPERVSTCWPNPASSVAMRGLNRVVSLLLHLHHTMVYGNSCFDAPRRARGDRGADLLVGAVDLRRHGNLTQQSHAGPGEARPSSSHTLAVEGSKIRRHAKSA